MAKDTVSINLDKTLTSLKIISIVVGVAVSIGICLFWFDARMDKLETDQATFKGVMEERTRNMSDNITRILDIVDDWSPDGQKTSIAEKEKETHPES